MAFNHYAKMKRILDTQVDGWYIRRIDRPTSAKNFRGETVEYDHYYRAYDSTGKEIKYCKFQKLDKFASVMGVNVEDVAVLDGKPKLRDENS